MVKNPYPGHTTTFADMGAAYEGLDPDRLHWWREQKMWHLNPFKPDPSKRTALHPVVHQQPFTGRTCLYLGGGRGKTIPQGMEEAPMEECNAAWAGLLDEALAAADVYDHVWEKGDIITWDNTQVMHR